jgi:hypothetical protein
MKYTLNSEEQSGTIYFHTDDGVPQTITFTVGEEDMLRAILDCISGNERSQPVETFEDLS